MKAGKAVDLALIEHMLSCLAAIDEFLAGDPNRYLQSRLVRDATLRNLQTMTESSQRLSAELKAEYPDIPWKKLAGLRNLLVHDYLGGIDDETVVRIFRFDMPALLATLQRMKEALSAR